jgi:hypothetical protein
MPIYYLRVDAVNLSQFVYDTNDISTIRGGSFLLLEAIDQIAHRFRGDLQPLTTAASQGLFTFRSQDATSGQRLLVNVLAFLREKTEGHATFVGAIEPEIEGQFPMVLERLEAQIRRQQWRLPTVAIPDDDATEQECFLDGWRPGVISYTVEPDIQGVKISRATAFRRRRGREIKHKLFYELLQEAAYADQRSTQDLGELARDPAQGNLNGKIAFIHIDGNSFGQIRRDQCSTPQSRVDFDDAVQNTFRIPFLAALLKHANHDQDFQVKGIRGGNNPLRLEVLLWGGDEVTMIVPAWKGWETLLLFFDHARHLSFQEVPLTHRAAIIFCHHNAPILQIRQLANSLLDLTKRDLQARAAVANSDNPDLVSLLPHQQPHFVATLANHRYGDAFHYLVLESLDMLQGSLTSFMSHYYRGASTTNLLVYGHEMHDIQAHVAVMRPYIARSKVLDIIDAVQHEQWEQIPLIVEQMLALVPQQKRSAVASAVQFLTAADPARWYVVADLWDYLPESNLI